VRKAYGDNVVFGDLNLHIERGDRIALVGEDVGGHGARRIEFRPTLGLARCRIATDRPVEKPRVAAPAPVIADAVGDVEFF